MFVKILLKEEKRTDIYECNNVSSWTAKKDSKIICLRLDMQMQFAFDKSAVEIYYLNAEGKTIDSVRC